MKSILFLLLFSFLLNPSAEASEENNEKSIISEHKLNVGVSLSPFPFFQYGLNLGYIVHPRLILGVGGRYGDRRSQSIFSSRNEKHTSVDLNALFYFRHDGFSRSGFLSALSIGHRFKEVLVSPENLPRQSYDIDSTYTSVAMYFQFAFGSRTRYNSDGTVKPRPYRSVSHILQIGPRLTFDDVDRDIRFGSGANSDSEDYDGVWGLWNLDIRIPITFDIRYSMTF